MDEEEEKRTEIKMEGFLRRGIIASVKRKGEGESQGDIKGHLPRHKRRERGEGERGGEGGEGGRRRKGWERR